MRFGRYFFQVSILVMASCLAAGQVSAQAPYFQNKTIGIIRGGRPGGTGDLQARALIPFLKKHIPGDPTIRELPRDPEIVSLYKRMADQGPLPAR